VKRKYNVRIAHDTEFLTDEEITGEDAETVKRKLKEVKKW
jgi:hypothetical protein